MEALMTAYLSHGGREFPCWNAPAMKETSPIAITAYPIRRDACRFCHTAMDREMRAVPIMSPGINVTPDCADPIQLSAPTTLRMPATIKKCGKKRMSFAIKVGTPVSRRPPRRSRRAELPHRAPQECAVVESIRVNQDSLTSAFGTSNCPEHPPLPPWKATAPGRFGQIRKPSWPAFHLPPVNQLEPRMSWAKIGIFPPPAAQFTGLRQPCADPSLFAQIGTISASHVPAPVPQKERPNWIPGALPATSLTLQAHQATVSPASCSTWSRLSLAWFHLPTHSPQWGTAAPSLRAAQNTKKAARLIIPRENPLTRGHLSRTALRLATMEDQHWLCQPYDISTGCANPTTEHQHF